MRAKPMAVAKSTVERVNQIELLYDSHEVALQSRVSEKSLHRWARQGLIPAVLYLPDLHQTSAQRGEDHL